MKERLWIVVVIVLFAALMTIGITMRSWLWGTAAILMAAVLLNGFVATLEDDLAEYGGNADGLITPRYIRTVAWVIRGIGAVSLAAIACALWLVKGS